MAEHTFDDVTPMTLDSSAVCNIMYDDDYRQLMGLTLALMNAGEISERALWITEQAIDEMASHYSVWIYRFDLIKGLGKSVEAELDWCEQVALDNEKNYQIWNYRQLLVELASKGAKFTPKRELPLINAMLDADAKNHHVWSYRLWLVKRFGLGDAEEIAWTNSLIEQDPSNNSAWCHKFSVVYANDNADVNADVAFVIASIRNCPQNPSSWNYLRGIVAKYPEFHKKLVDVATGCESTMAYEVLAEGDPSYYTKLVEVDPIHRNYWLARQSAVQA